MAHSKSDTAFLTMVHSFTYRGVREEWACAYHLDQVPRDAADWNGLMNWVWPREANFLPADVQFERAYGHNPGEPPVLVFEHDQPPVGEGGDAGSWVPTASDHHAPGDAAAWIRYGTTQKNTLGKPIYLRNYYHGIYVLADGNTIAAGQRTQMDLLGAGFVAGAVINGITFRRAGPRGAVGQNHAVSTWATTRTLKARGKRHRITKADLEAAARARDVPVFAGPATG